MARGRPNRRYSTARRVLVVAATAIIVLAAMATPAIEFVTDGDRELREIERALAAAETEAGTDPHTQRMNLISTR